MKCFAAVLFFTLLTERSFATECCSNNTLDIASAVTKVQLIVDNITLPPVECGDQWSGEFKNSIVQAMIAYAKALLEDRLTKARHLGNELIENIQKAYDRLKRAIILVSKSHSKRIALEKSVRKLTDQCWKFLELRPGNGTICNPPVLPDVPVLPLNLKSIPTQLSAKDMFLNGDLTLYNRNLQIFGWLAYLVRTMIIKRTYVGLGESIREQMNDEILNCSVMGAYKRIVNKVLKHADFIRAHVSLDTWEYCQDAADRILDISKAYCEALKLGKP